MKFKQILKSYNRFEKIFSVFLIVILIGSCVSLYLKVAPDELRPNTSSGVVFREGLYGSVQKLNPMYTDFNIVDQDISRLLFCSLSQHNPETGQIEESIASHTLDLDQKVYSFTIYPDITWHDGEPVTADDVVFTFNNVIKNGDFQNRILKDTFSDVEIVKISDQTVEFRLTAPNSFFFSSLVVGLLPEHILKDVPVSELFTDPFNVNPIGCGPFEFESISRGTDVTQVTLKRYEDYFETGGSIDRVLFNVYPDFATLIERIDSVHGMARVPIYLKDTIEDSRLRLNEYTLPQYTALFINTAKETLSSKNVRLGIKKAIQKQSIVDRIGYKKVIDTPLLELNQDDWRNQSDADQAMGALFDAGWSLNEETGTRTNEAGEELTLTLVSRKYDENSKAQEITELVLLNIEQQLRTVGIKLEIKQLPLAELETAIMDRDYDLLLYGQSLGYNLDVYSFWHSSQIDDGLNLSNYANPQADSLIERIRSDFDNDNKNTKLAALAEIFTEDIPAVFLYTPSYYYAVDKEFSGIKSLYLATPTDRLNKAHLWETN